MPASALDARDFDTRMRITSRNVRASTFSAAEVANAPLDALVEPLIEGAYRKFNSNTGRYAKALGVMRKPWWSL